MELEEVKSHYRNKITEMEAAAKKQERKGNNNLRKRFTRFPSLQDPKEMCNTSLILVAQVCHGNSLANSG